MYKLDLFKSPILPRILLYYFIWAMNLLFFLVFHFSKWLPLEIVRSSKSLTKIIEGHITSGKWKPRADGHERTIIHEI